MLTKKDVQQIENHGLSLDEIIKQLETFRYGIPFANVVTAASVGNGIEVISKPNQKKLIALYERKRDRLEVIKFVPASGAATRMFQFLHHFLEDYDPNEETLREYLKEGNYKALATFFGRLKDFAFVNAVRKKIKKNYSDYKRSTKGMRSYMLVKSLLEEPGLNYSNLPKGLIPFHKYTKYAITAFEEQLYETAFYAATKEDAYLHFTFSEKHVSYFKEEFEAVKNRVRKKTKVEYHISYSFQKKKTDTLAVTEDNTPFRDENNELVFRPSGHGALIENLNEVDADVVFIKNIDNVVVQEYVEGVAFYKKVLAGKLLWLQRKIFSYLEILSKNEISEEMIKEIRSFIWNELNIKDIPERKHKIFDIINRPLRVCGVVKNTGAPGGGPFWVKNDDNEVLLQIVELAQINTENERQRAIVAEATHFNPVDIVCGLRDYRGNKFDLLKFTDPNTGFISEKSQNGKSLKALELPGLWNGAMGKWNTVFVEVPLHTFNPVKTVNDLLRKEHRPNA